MKNVSQVFAGLLLLSMSFSLVAETFENSELDLGSGSKGSVEGPLNDYKGEFVQGLPAYKYESGQLMMPNLRQCDELKVFFPGHAQELGLKAEVPTAKEKLWISYLLGKGNYHLAEPILSTNCPVFVLGDSNRGPSAQEIRAVAEKAGASKLHLLAHSGGYAGLNKSLKAWDSALSSTVVAIKMLDNFYSSDLAATMRRVFGSEKLKTICQGFRTQHNNKRYSQYYSKICPQIVIKKSHKAPVREYF